MNISEKFEDRLVKLYTFCTSYPKTVLTVFLFSLFFSLFIPNLHFHITTEKLVQENSLAAIRLNKTSENFPIRNSLYLYFYSSTPFKGNELCGIDEWLRFQGRHNENVNAIRSPFLLREPKFEKGSLTYPYLFSPPCLDQNKDLLYSFDKLENTPWQKIFTSTDHLFFGEEVLFHDTPGGSSFGDFDPRVLGQFKEELEKFLKEKLPHVQVHFLGHMGQFYYGLQGIKHTQFLNVLIVLVLVGLSRLVFGTFKSGILLAMTLALMGGFVYGAMALTKTPVDSLSVGLFLILTIAVIEDFFFVSAWQLKSENKSDDLFRKFLLPCFLTSLTTILGFGSLCFTDLTIIQRFGFWAAYGCFLEWALIFFFLPAFVRFFPSFSIWTNSSRSFFHLLTIPLLKKKLPTLFIKPLLLVGVLGAFSLGQLKIADSPYEIFPKSHPFRLGLSQIEKNTGWQASFDMIFIDKDQVSFNESILKKISQHPIVSFIQNPYEIERFYTKGLPPLTQQLVLTEYSFVSDYKRYVSEEGALHAVVFVKANQVEVFDNFVKDIEKWCEGGTRCYPTGEIIAFSDISMRIPKVLIESFLYSIFLVSLVLLFLLWQTKHWSARNAFALMASCLWGPLVMIFIFWGFRIPLNFITCVFASVLVGLTGDNAIQFLLSSRKKTIDEGIKEQGHGSLAIALISLLASSVFLFSYFSAMRTLGLLSAIGIFLMNFGDIWLLKGLLENKKTKDPNP